MRPLRLAISSLGICLIGLSSAIPCVTDPYEYADVRNFIMDSNPRMPLQLPALEVLQAAGPAGDTNQQTWNTIVQFSLESAKVFDLILQCAGNDPDKARQAYFENKFPCSDSIAKNIEQKVTELKTQIYNLLMTTELDFTNVGFNYVNAHPFFVQLVMEYSSTIIRFANNGISGRGSVQDEWIDRNWGVEFNKRVQSLLPPRTLIKDYDELMKIDPQGTNELIGNFISNNKDLGSSAFSLPRLYKNSVFMLAAIVNTKTCDNFGLWEELGRKYAYIVSNPVDGRPTGMVKHFYHIRCEKDNVDGSNIYQMKALQNDIKPEFAVAFFRSLAKQKNWNLLQDESSDEETHALCKVPVKKVVAKSVLAVSTEDLADKQFQVTLEVTKSSSWQVRLGAAKLLADMNTSRATQALLGMLNDSDSDVRFNAINLLGSKKLEQADALKIVNSLLDSIKPVQAEAAKFLRNYKLNDEFASHLEDVIKNGNWSSRLYAATVLELIKTDKSIAMLASLLMDDDVDVRKAAFDALEKQTLKSEHVKYFVAPFNHRGWKTRLLVVLHLRRIRSAEARNLLIEHLNDSDVDVRAAIKKSLKKFDIEVPSN